jgi:hypothetical protein
MQDQLDEAEQNRAQLTHEECKRIKNIPEYELEGQVVDGKALADVCENAVYRIYKRQDRQHIGQDPTGDHQSE